MTTNSKERFKEVECRTLNQLCNVLNEMIDEDPPLEFINKTIEKNGWTDLQGVNQWDICTDGEYLLHLTEQGDYDTSPLN